MATIQRGLVRRTAVTVSCHAACVATGRTREWMRILPWRTVPSRAAAISPEGFLESPPKGSKPVRRRESTAGREGESDAVESDDALEVFGLREEIERLDPNWLVA